MGTFRYKNGKYSGEMELDAFLSMPRRAQQLFFQYMESKAMDTNENPYTALSLMNWDLSKCESPIEKIFLYAYRLYVNCIVFESEEKYDLYPQVRINCGDNLYRADFVFDTELKEESYFDKEFRVVVECDGHFFHKVTKEQVKKDNERDIELKMCGYDVIHFSGTQIYSEPIKCAKDLFEYIKQNTEINNG